MAYCATHSGADGSLLVLQRVSFAVHIFIYLEVLSSRGTTDVWFLLRATYATHSGPYGSLLVLQLVSIADVFVMFSFTGNN
jgi:hypothetical protein